ncbi:MAG TPA: tetratricopeptide repeat protein [Chthonomonadaceae bacterium]|nr:tetratricopeptide repeat protein [Chthonomonadaceae bacterium]
MNYGRFVTCLGMIVLTATGAFAQVNKPPHVHVIGGQEDMPQLNALMKAADGAFASGNYAEAEELYKQALIILPGGKPRLNLAEIYEHEDRLAEAAEQYDQLIFDKKTGSSIGGDPITHMRYVLLLLKLNRWSDAVSVYAAHTGYTVPGLPDFDAKRPDFDRMAALAHALVAAFNPRYSDDRLTIAQRRAHIDEALKLNPKDAFVHWCEGQWYRRAGKDAEAKAAFLRAAAIPGADRTWQERAKAAAEKIKLPPAKNSSSPQPAESP